MTSILRWLEASINPGAVHTRLVANVRSNPQLGSNPQLAGFLWSEYVGRVAWRLAQSPTDIAALRAAFSG